MSRGKNVGPRSTKHKKKTFQNLMTFLALGFFVSVIAVTCFYQNNKYSSLAEEEKHIVKQIEQEKDKNLEYKNLKEYYKSDAYIEKIAREQLGLIKPDELIIINRAN